jgi:penicillin-binding protein 1A
VKLTWRSALGLIVACVALFFIARSLQSGLGQLGTYRFQVSPWRIVGAFGVFAAQGYRAEPFLITRILDKDGNLLEEVEPSAVEIISPQLLI